MHHVVRRTTSLIAIALATAATAATSATVAMAAPTQAFPSGGTAYTIKNLGATH